MIKLTDGGLVYQVNDTLFNSKCSQGNIKAEFPDLIEDRAHELGHSLGLGHGREVNPDGTKLMKLIRLKTHVLEKYK